MLKSAAAICTCMCITLKLKINLKMITFSDNGSNTRFWSDTNKGLLFPFLSPDHKKTQDEAKHSCWPGWTGQPRAVQVVGKIRQWLMCPLKHLVQKGFFQSQKSLSIPRASRKSELAEAVSFKSRALSKNLGKNASPTPREQSLLPLSAGL